MKLDLTLILCVVYIVVGLCAFVPTLKYYANPWVHDLPWLVIALGEVAVIMLSVLWLLGIQILPVSIVLENYQAKLIATGVTLLIFGGTNLRKDKVFLVPFTLAWIMMFAGAITLAVQP